MARVLGAGILWETGGGSLTQPNVEFFCKMLIFLFFRYVDVAN
jgi:hypothetical protein